MHKQGLPGEPVLGPSPFGIELSTDTVAAEARLSGELDIASAPRLQAVLDQLLHDGYRYVKIDLSKLEFLGCAGLSVLLRASDRYQQAGGQLTLAQPSPATRRILQITALDTALHLA